MRMKKIVGAVACMTVLSAGAMAVEMSNAQIYEKYCKKCHGANGEGNPAKKGPALNDKDINELFDALYSRRSPDDGEIPLLLFQSRSQLNYGDGNCRLHFTLPPSISIFTLSFFSKNSLFSNVVLDASS